MERDNIADPDAPALMWINSSPACPKIWTPTQVADNAATEKAGAAKYRHA